jgi:hypothetical protein
MVTIKTMSIGHPEYRTWVGMLQRCGNPKSKGFKNYGGRGVMVEDRRWHVFENFLADMGPRPPGMTLDRADNDRGYSRANCRWATWSEQQKNRRPASDAARANMSAAQVGKKRSPETIAKMLATRAANRMEALRADPD